MDQINNNSVHEISLSYRKPSSPKLGFLVSGLSLFDKFSHVRLNDARSRKASRARVTCGYEGADRQTHRAIGPFG